MGARSGNLLPCNAKAVKYAKPLNGRRTEYRIEGIPGLILDVRPNGSASFRVVYHTLQGRVRKLRRVLIGSPAVVPLSDARERANEFMRAVRAGADPVGEDRQRREAMTFRQLAETRLEKDTKLSERTKLDYRADFLRDVYPAFADIPAAEVTPEAVVALLDKVEARAPGRVDNVKVAIGSTYKWARKRRIVATDPTLGLGNRSPKVPRNRVLNDDEIRNVWGAIESGKLAENMQLILKLLLLTGQRESEVAGAKVSELRLDDPNPQWTMLGHSVRRGQLVHGRTKSGQSQSVPLSRQAAALFRRAVELANGSEYVFPADMSRVRAFQDPKLPHIRGDSVSSAMIRLRTAFNLKDITVHDLRRTMATQLGERGVLPHILKLILNHKPKSNDVTEMHYNFARYSTEVRRAHQLWADHVEAVVEWRSAPVAEVVALGSWGM